MPRQDGTSVFFTLVPPLQERCMVPAASSQPSCAECKCHAYLRATTVYLCVWRAWLCSPTLPGIYIIQQQWFLGILFCTQQTGHAALLATRRVISLPSWDCSVKDEGIPSDFEPERTPYTA